MSRSRRRARVEARRRAVRRPLIVLTGPTNVLWVDAATFLVSAATIAFGLPKPAESKEHPPTSYLRELREGYAFLRRDRTLSVLVLTVALTNSLDAVAMVALPVYAREIYGSAVSLGLLLGAAGAGSVVGALAFAGLGERLSRRAVFSFGFLFTSAWYPVAAAFPPLGVLLAAKFVSGIASGPLNPVIDTVFLERVPDGMRGRVFGATHAAAWIAMPLGVLVAGWLIDAVGLRATLLGSGAAYIAVTLTARFSSALRDLDRRPEPAVRV